MKIPISERAHAKVFPLLFLHVSKDSQDNFKKKNYEHPIPLSLTLPNGKVETSNCEFVSQT
jgi:hypothetical protein